MGGAEALGLAASRAILGAALAGGGGISNVAALFEAGAASSGCLDAGLFAAALEAFGAGVAEAALCSPIVMRMKC